MRAASLNAQAGQAEVSSAPASWATLLCPRDPRRSRLYRIHDNNLSAAYASIAGDARVKTDSSLAADVIGKRFSVRGYIRSSRSQPPTSKIAPTWVLPPRTIADSSRYVVLQSASRDVPASTANWARRRETQRAFGPRIATMAIQRLRSEMQRGR